MLIGPVYLAGGMHCDWRKQWINSFPDVEFYDPSSHGLTDEKSYTAWDLAYIRKCETVVGYMDQSNPSGYGLCLEIGYARALHKRIIFIDECDSSRTEYFGMAREISDEVYNSTANALKAL